MTHAPHHNADTISDSVQEHRSGTALILAGAGAAGNAWQLGLIAGLSDAGVDLTAADLIIGTWRLPSRSFPRRAALRLLELTPTSWSPLEADRFP